VIYSITLWLKTGTDYLAGAKVVKFPRLQFT